MQKQMLGWEQNMNFIVAVRPNGEYFAFNLDEMTKLTIKEEVEERGGDPRLFEQRARSTAEEAINAARPYLEFARRHLAAEHRQQVSRGFRSDVTNGPSMAIFFPEIANYSVASPLFPERSPSLGYTLKGFIPKFWRQWRVRRLIRSFQT